ncbi:hypothetical protein IAU60_004474 [Kwoniella sp. DSM 27419]
MVVDGSPERSRASSLDCSEPDSDDAPKSIASLRSRFENLAAANGPPTAIKAPAGLRRSFTPTFTPGGSVDLGKGASGGVSGNEPDGAAVSAKVSERRPSPDTGATWLIRPQPSSRPASPAPQSLASMVAHTPPQSSSATRSPSGRPVTPKPALTAISNRDTGDDVPKLGESSTPRLTPTASPVLRSSSRSSSPPEGGRRPPPVLPSKPSSVTMTPSGSDDGMPDEEPIVSVKALRERFSAEATGSTNTPPRSVSSDASKRLEALPMASKQVSAPVIRRTSISGETSTPVLLSPPVDADAASNPLSTTHMSREARPPPTSRSASPAPPAPNRATKPPPRNTPSPAPTQSSPAPPPQLPQRKPTIKSSDKGSNTSLPPTPKSVFSQSLAAEPSTSSDDGPGPPPLPNRSRASTISKPEVETVTTPAPGPPPPRLPARHATVSGSGSIGPASIPASPARSRENTNELLPPPVRTALANTGHTASPPRKRTDSGDKTAEAYSEDDDDDADEADPLAGLSAAAKRMMEDFPDSTEANRRAPKFTPDLRIRDLHHVSAFAMFGRHVCLGSHHVRVYDTQLSDHPIFVVDLKETGLEHRKDPRVTAMCFRPGATLAEEGRYLWCGTKDGHLWELDISTGQVSQTKSFAHTAPVAHVFRHQKMLLSLDELGKLLVFEVGDVEGQPPTMIRTLRVMEKFTFAKMLCGKLWTSSGPSARSTTSAATSRGPTIRVYDPCAPGSMPPAKVLFTTEWTGAVTSATYIPLRPDVIYLGHEGGFVSLWDAQDFTCIQVLKISTTDILSLEGVGERLWAGNRKGQICVYDTESRPWRTINVWTGHPLSDNPVTLLLVDPFSIEHSGRYTCWSYARDCLRAWDGLLSVGWIDKQMVEREPDYCTFRDAKVLVCSWNIDSAKPTDLTGSEGNVRFLEECLTSVDSPDIIVFGFQEVIPLTDKKITAKTLLFGGKNKDSTSGSDKITHAYRQWLDKLTQAVRLASSPDCPYVKIHSESLVGLFSCIFVKSSEKDSLRDLNITTVKRGLGNIYGNKGAIVARLIMDDTSICFINVHLAAGQSQKAARNADLAAIMEDKAIFPASNELPFVHGGEGTGILDHEMVILNGDLNYRIDQRRENVISSIHAGELAYLLEHDQLRKEMRSNHAFRLRSFDEAPITFAPTYKYNPGTQDYDSSEKRRIPAWCDRILYRKGPRIKAVNYRRYEPTVSDHRPISCGFAITLKSVDSLRMMEVRREAAGEWAEREKGMLMQMSENVQGFV